jgi:rod shape-determining protein MreB
MPALVAVRSEAGGRRLLTAYGDAARRLLGREPPSRTVLRPFQGGRVADPDAAEALLTCALRESHGRNTLVRPLVRIAVPPDATPADHRALRDAATTAGARKVTWVSRPLAAALGAGLPIDAPAGHLLLDVGASAVHLAVLSLGRVVASARVAAGGDEVDAAIARHLKRNSALLVGPVTAEAVKLHAASLSPEPSERVATAAGRCLRTGLPGRAVVRASDLSGALGPLVDAVGLAVRRILDQVPREIAADVTEHGAVLVGGGSRLRGLGAALRDRTGLPVVEADDPERAVLRGLTVAVRDAELQRALAA